MEKIITKCIARLPNIENEISEDEYPIITTNKYQERINSAIKKCKNKFTHLIIYADREHFSNMEYFSGYDPRFEEALLILSEYCKPAIIAGDEGCSYAKKIPYDVDIILYPTFSLPSQPRDKSIKLSDIFKELGVTTESKVGLIGWKLFSEEDFINPEKQYDFPCFIINELVKIVDLNNVSNATGIMIDNNEGLRIVLDAEELVLCELAGTKSSRKTYNVLKNLKDGMTEIEASSFLNIDGDPLNAFPMVSFGKNLFLAVASPSHNRTLKQGDLVGAGMSYRRSLCHKTSYFVKDYSELTNDAKRMFDLYFRSLIKWYESIKVGITGGEVYKRVKEVVGDYKTAGIALNPGHLIHTEEWTNSPFSEGNNCLLKSGMAIQCDFASSLPLVNVCIHEEDGIILADKDLRAKIFKIAPKTYQRMMNRREFMIHELGIQLDESVLPTSDLPAVVFPCLKNINIVLARVL